MFQSNLALIAIKKFQRNLKVIRSDTSNPDNQVPDPTTGVVNNRSLPPEDFKGTLLPISGKELQLLPEGDRERASIVVWSITKLSGSSSRDSSYSDIVIDPLTGEEFKVMNSQNRRIGNFHRVVCERYRRGPNDERV